MKTQLQIAKQLKKGTKLDAVQQDMAIDFMLQHAEDCQMFLSFLQKNYANFTWEGLRRSINPMQKMIKDLKLTLTFYKTLGVAA